METTQRSHGQQKDALRNENRTLDDISYESGRRPAQKNETIFFVLSGLLIR